MNLNQYYKIILNNLETENFFDMVDKRPSFLTDSSYFFHDGDGDQNVTLYYHHAERMRFICGEDINISFTECKLDDIESSTHGQFGFYKRMKRPQVIQLKEAHIGFYFNSSRIFTIPMLKIVEEGDGYYLPYGDDFCADGLIGILLSAFLTKYHSIGHRDGSIRHRYARFVEYCEEYQKNISR